MSDKRDFLSYFEERVKEHGQRAGSGEFNFHCMFCLDRMGDESSKRKLGVNIALKKAHCFRCGYGADTLVKLLRDLNGGKLTMEEMEILRGEPKHVPVASIRNAVLEVLYGEDEKAASLKPQALPSHLVWLKDAEESDPRIKRAVDYLTQRHVPREKIEQFNIGYCTRGSHVGHLIFPIYQGGELVYWTTRITKSGVDQKSKNPVNKDGYYSRAHCLLNYDNCVGQPVVAVVEGPFDAMAFPFAVAGMGKKLSEQQIGLIESLTRQGTEEIVVALDAGEGEASDAYYRALNGRVPKVTQLTLDYGDPDERKGEINTLLDTRREPTVVDRVKARLLYNKS